MEDHKEGQPNTGDQSLAIPKVLSVSQETPKTPTIRGRSPVITESILQQLAIAFRMDLTDEEACDSVGISTSTLYNYQKANPDFLEEKRYWKNSPFIKAKRSVLAGLGDPQLALRWLKARQPKNYSSRLSNSFNGPMIQINAVVFGQNDPLYNKAINNAREQQSKLGTGSD